MEGTATLALCVWVRATGRGCVGVRATERSHQRCRTKRELMDDRGGVGAHKTLAVSATRPGCRIWGIHGAWLPVTATLPVPVPGI